MQSFDPKELPELFMPSDDSHKGQNGRVLLIGGSQLFHAASLWALTVASRIVDLVHYASIPENNALVHEAKAGFRNGIVIPRSEIENYIVEDDVILIGPGMVRSEIPNSKFQIPNSLSEILEIEDEGVQTAALTNYLLEKYPHKQWVIDAGSVQMLDVDLIPKHAILTPHQGEFVRLVEQHKSGANEHFDATSVSLAEQQVVDNSNHRRSQSEASQNIASAASVQSFARDHKCIILLKGQTDLVSNGEEVYEVHGGNSGMTKGGTGDVLAGLVAALACKNNPFLAARAASYINKQAGDDLYKDVGPYFNASDLADQIPRTMKRLLVK